MGQVKKIGDVVWVARKKGSNITRLMNEKEVLSFSAKTGQTVFTKLKKYELDQL